MSTNTEKNTLILTFNKDLYPKEAMIKAAYRFIVDCYVYLNQTAADYVIEITAKETALPENLANEFRNELLAQTVRLQVYKQTHVIRELLMARAMASTIISEPPTGESAATEADADLNEITKDWFEKYGQK